MGKANRTIISSHSHVHFNGPSHLARSSGLYQPATHNRTYKSNWLARLACVCLCERTRALFTMHWLPIDIHFVVIWYFTQCTAILYYAGKSTFSQIAFFHFYSSKQLQKTNKQNKTNKKTNELLIKAIYAWRQTVCIGWFGYKAVGRSIGLRFVCSCACSQFDWWRCRRSVVCFNSTKPRHGSFFCINELNQLNCDLKLKLIWSLAIGGFLAKIRCYRTSNK